MLWQRGRPIVLPVAATQKGRVSLAGLARAMVNDYTGSVRPVIGLPSTGIEATMLCHGVRHSG